MAFWPAWLVAPALAALAVGNWVVLRRPLGVSGILARFARLREELERDERLAALQAERAALAAAKAAAAAADPGRTITARWTTLPPDVAAAAGGRTCAPTPPVPVHATFLASLAAGGLLAAVVRGAFAGADGAWVAHVGAGPRSFLALAAGGLLAGFGAALSGGCAAGHGLTGCGRLMPGSLVATPVLLAAAVATSLLLRSLG